MYDEYVSNLFMKYMYAIQLSAYQKMVILSTE